MSEPRGLLPLTLGAEGGCKPSSPHSQQLMSVCLRYSHLLVTRHARATQAAQWKGRHCQLGRL